MPGLIDGHVHLMINAHFDTIEKNLDLTDIAYRATVVAKRFLLDGFTTVRDMGGPTFGLRRNIDNGLIVGPRVFSSGGFISQTSGHGDFRDRADPGLSIQAPGDLSNFERMGIGAVADGVPAVLAPPGSIFGTAPHRLKSWREGVVLRDLTPSTPHSFQKRKPVPS